MIKIPPVALEAGARAIADTDCPASLFLTCESHHGGCMCRDQARAAITAALNAWPGMQQRPFWDLMTHARHVEIILPQEARDE